MTSHVLKSSCDQDMHKKVPSHDHYNHVLFGSEHLFYTSVTAMNHIEFPLLLLVLCLNLQILLAPEQFCDNTFSCRFLSSLA